MILFQLPGLHLFSFIDHYQHFFFFSKTSWSFFSYFLSCSRSLQETQACACSWSKKISWKNTQDKQLWQTRGVQFSYLAIRVKNLHPKTSHFPLAFGACVWCIGMTLMQFQWGELFVFEPWGIHQTISLLRFTPINQDFKSILWRLRWLIYIYYIEQWHLSLTNALFHSHVTS